jgi:AraC-like DNA-binding protein
MQTHLPMVQSFKHVRVDSKASWEQLAKVAQFRPNALAELCGVSMRTLQRYFRAHYDQTVSDWLRDLRLNEALSSLKQCDSVKEVAFDLGYKQPSHFTRDFKKKFGVPPRALMVHPRHHRLPAR